MPVSTAPIRVYPKSIADLDRLFRGFLVTTDPNTVGPAELMTDAVTEEKVADDAITADKIAANAVTTSKILDDAVTDAKLRNSTARSVIGRSAATAGDPADIAADADGKLLIRRAGSLGFDVLGDTDIPGSIARDSEVSAAAAAAQAGAEATAAAALSAALAALNLASGTYTPTRSAEANLDSNVTMSQAQYLRVGSVVTVSGRFTADPTLAATTTSFEGTLPVASNIGAAEDVAGMAFCGNIAAQGAEIIGVAANDTFKVQWKAGDVTSQTWSYAFVYRVI